MSSNSIQLYPLPRTLVLNARGTRTKPKARIGKSTHTQIHRILDVGKQEASNRADNAGGISQHNIKSNVEETRQNGKLGNSNGTLQYYDIDVTNHNNNNNNNYNNNNSNNNIGQSKSILSTNKLKTAQRIDRKQTKTVLSQNLNKPCKSIQKTNPNQLRNLYQCQQHPNLSYGTKDKGVGIGDVKMDMGINILKYVLPERKAKGNKDNYAQLLLHEQILNSSSNKNIVIRDAQMRIKRTSNNNKGCGNKQQQAQQGDDQKQSQTSQVHVNKHAGVSEKVDSRRQELPHKEVTKHQPVIHKYKYRSADIENTNVNANINHPNIDDLYTYKYTKKDQRSSERHKDGDQAHHQDQNQQKHSALLTQIQELSHQNSSKHLIISLQTPLQEHPQKLSAEKAKPVQQQIPQQKQKQKQDEITYAKIKDERLNLGVNLQNKKKSQRNKMKQFMHNLLARTKIDETATIKRNPFHDSPPSKSINRGSSVSNGKNQSHPNAGSNNGQIGVSKTQKQIKINKLSQISKKLLLESDTANKKQKHDIKLPNVHQYRNIVEMVKKQENLKLKQKQNKLYQGQFGYKKMQKIDEHEEVQLQAQAQKQSQVEQKICIQPPQTPHASIKPNSKKPKSLSSSQTNSKAKLMRRQEIPRQSKQNKNIKQKKQVSKKKASGQNTNSKEYRKENKQQQNVCVGELKPKQVRISTYRASVIIQQQIEYSSIGRESNACVDAYNNIEGIQSQIYAQADSNMNNEGIGLFKNEESRHQQEIRQSIKIQDQ